MFLRIAFIVLLFIIATPAQDPNCDFLQKVQVGFLYYLSSPRYPERYPGGIQCRWIAVCPSGYNCRLNCPFLDIPKTTSCVLDRLLISRTGDPQLNAAEVYCGSGSLTAVSKEQHIAIGLITAINSTGGRFLCQISAQVAAIPPSNCQCGSRKQNRIVDGEETGVNEFPMMAALVDVSFSHIRCGGTIISRKFVLTAAHCLISQRLNNTLVVVGEHNISNFAKPNQGYNNLFWIKKKLLSLILAESSATRVYKVKRLITNPLFTESNYDYDIGLVEVEDPIQLSDRVGVACLPFKFVDTNFTGAKVIMLGWGTLFPGGPISNVLRQVTVDVISDSQCRTKVSNLSSRQMCTYTPGKDACQYDSGGPVLYTDTTTGRLFVVGIVSYGRFCASEYPGINTRVTTLLDWIVNTTRASYCYM